MLFRTRSYWCSRGGLYVVVKAHSHGHARKLAGNAFARGNRDSRRTRIYVRKATSEDLARWRELLAQETEIRARIKAEKEAAGAPHPGQGELFG